MIAQNTCTLEICQSAMHHILLAHPHIRLVRENWTGSIGSFLATV